MYLQRTLTLLLVVVVSQALASFYQNCQRPEDPAYGSVLSKNWNQILFYPGEKVWFKCDNGYDLDGGKYVVCQKNGYWQPQPFPRCVRRDQNCRRPGKPAYGSVISKNWNQILFNSGEKVWFKCDDGYYLDGRKYFVCQENGNWQPQPFPRCFRQNKKCRRPENPAYGSVLSQNLNQNLFNPGEKVWFKCDYGYDLDGIKYVVCQKNGNWQPQPFPRCVRRVQKCKRPDDPAYGRVLSNNWNQKLFNPGEKVWLKCNYGYYLEGRKYVVCQENGNWQPQPFPKCVRQNH